MQTISEEMKVHEEWYKQSNDVTVETLPDFIKHLTEDYQHDYGTICHAMVAGALATMRAIDKSPTGGITGFQAGCIMWKFIRRWNFSSNKCGLKLLDYDNLLYPQYGDKFDKVITADAWKNVKEQARLYIANYEKEVERYNQSVQEYPAKMEEFLKTVTEYCNANPSEPGYEDNPKYYQEVSYGTYSEHENFKKKKEAGTPIQPREPYFGGASDSVLSHWKNIVNGIMPFGFRLGEE